MDVLGFFHLDFCQPRLYNYIPIALQRDVQVAFHFPLDKLTQDPYDVVIWHLLLLLPQWCFTLLTCGGVTWHKETQIQF
jgi:hypothetical protein